MAIFLDSEWFFMSKLVVQICNRFVRFVLHDSCFFDNVTRCIHSKYRENYVGHFNVKHIQ